MDNTENKDMILIPAQTSLRQRAVMTGSSSSAFRQAIKAAEAAIEDLSVEFDDWINEDVDKMVNICNLIAKEGWNKENSDKLFIVTHDLKGQATTLGYPVITEICNTLCHMLEKIPDTSRISVQVVITFAESIRTIIGQCQKNEENPKANAISSGLRQMAMKIIRHEMEIAKPKNKPAKEDVEKVS